MLACTQKQARRLCLQESRTEEARWQQSRNKWRRRSAVTAECDNARRREDDSVHLPMYRLLREVSLHAPPRNPPRQHRKRATSAAVRRAPSLHPPPATPRASIVRVCVCVCVCVCVFAWCFV